MAPLTPELEKLLALAPAAEREGLRKQLESGFLRQEDYSREMNTLKEAEKARVAAYATGKQWVEDNRTYYTEAIKQRDVSIQRAKEAEDKLAALTAAAAKPTEPDINLQDEAAVSKALRQAQADASQARADAGKLAESIAKFEKMLSDGQLLTASQFEAEATKRLSAFSEAVMETLDTKQRAIEEFGKPIDRKELLAAAAEYNGDLTKAYEKVTEKMRVEKMKADIRKEVTDELKATMANAGSPLATGSSPLSLGPLQQRVYATKNPESTIDASIPADGSGRLAYQIAQELRAEGKV